MSPTFFGADPWDGSAAGVVFLGAPYDRSLQPGRGGSRDAPGALREASLQLPICRDDEGRPLGWLHNGLQRTVLRGVELWDGGDLALDPRASCDEVDGRVEGAVRATVQAGATPCLLGGEHALTRPAVRGVASALGEPVTLLFFDAHTDRGLSHWGGRYPRDSFVDSILDDGAAASMIQLGLRDIGHPGNSRVPPGLTPCSVIETRRLGPRGLLQSLPDSGPLYLSIDVDVLSPCEAPGTRTAVPGGLGLDELLALLEPVAGSGRVVAVDFMEMAPGEDRAGLTATAAWLLLIGVLGMALG